MSCDFHKSPVGDLKPELFWKNFYAITRIPRPSKHEEGIIEFLKGFAKEHSLECVVDKAGSVLIRKPASKGYENAPGVILQGHMDMVCEKNGDKEFDFFKQPIEIVRDGGVIRADGTSLGADNGAGVAAGLAILEDETAVHPALECFFTVDEETGMTGAKSVEPGFLSGKYLLNLDSEDENDLYIGCAGGIDSCMSFVPEWKDSCASGCPKVSAYKVTVKGLKGGHSGLEIIEQRANAIKLLARFLRTIAKDGIKYSVASFEGGNKRNAIPREASALLCCKDSELLIEAAAKYQQIFCEEFKGAENNVEVVAEASEEDVTRVMTKESRDRLLNAIMVIPHGVIRMSKAVPGLVETSTNLAIVRADGDRIAIDMSHRSSSETIKMALANRIEALAELIGFDYSRSEGYPGWQPNVDSKLLAAAVEAYKETLGHEVRVTAIHAGLECGLIMDKFPGMEAISFGPTLKGVHSPDETIDIQSVEHFSAFLKELLRKLK